MRKSSGARCSTNAAVGNVQQNACAANTTVADTVACVGAAVGDFVVVKPRTAPDAGLAFAAGQVLGNNTVTIYVINTTAGALPAGAAGIDYDVLCLPPE